MSRFCNSMNCIGSNIWRLGEDCLGRQRRLLLRVETNVHEPLCMGYQLEATDMAGGELEVPATSSWLSLKGMQ
ncbi:hypothetical protein MA16_Dca024690 [Dendrobium catenatum]|uniref:Uncharacterized protein n=1 Tax=Dendrobium catenatum TaxID=906689 RepID=A0A2I0VG38_9ASPA|nr:hypothetical protein MA16_Dca024690 [Dendrobium catenatum]